MLSKNKEIRYLKEVSISLIGKTSLYCDELLRKIKGMGNPCIKDYYFDYGNRSVTIIGNHCIVCVRDSI